MGKEPGPAEPVRQHARGAVLLPGQVGGSDRRPCCDSFMILSNLNMPYFPIYFLFKMNVKKKKLKGHNTKQGHNKKKPRILSRETMSQADY